VEEPGFFQFVQPVLSELNNTNIDISYLFAFTEIPSSNFLEILNISKKRIIKSSLCSHIKTIDMFISPSIWSSVPKENVSIHISHNLPLIMKIESYSKSVLSNFNYHFLTGPLHRNWFLHMYEKNEVDDRKSMMLDIGYPKSDKLVNGEYDRIEILKSLNLDVNKQTVIYAPAWDPNTSLHKYGTQLFEILSEIQNINVIVKLHPVSYTNKSHPHYKFYTGGTDWMDVISRYEKNINFKHVPNYSIDPLLAASDILITDISSVSLEFIVLDKPVIYIDCPEFYEKTLEEWEQDSKSIKTVEKFSSVRNVGIVCKDLSELETSVIRSLHHPHEFSEKRKTLSDQILYNPGKGSITSAQKILDLLELN